MKKYRAYVIIGALLLVIVLTPVFAMGYTGNSVTANPLDSLVVSKGDIYITPVNCTNGINQTQGSIKNIGDAVSPDITIEVTFIDSLGLPVSDGRGPMTERGRVLVHIGVIAGGQTIPFTAQIETVDSDLAFSWTYRLLTQ